MEDTKIGKIQGVSFGKGGYQDAMIGINFTLGSDKGGWGVGDFWGDWGLERSKYCKWTEKERITHLGEVVMRINKLLEQAKVDKVQDLKGTPIEVTFESNTLKSWRILEEVI